MVAKQVFDKPNSQKGADSGAKVVEEFLHETVVMLGLGFVSLWRNFLKRPFLTTLCLIGLHFASQQLVIHKLYLSVLACIVPPIIPPSSIAKWFGQFNTLALANSVFALAMMMIIVLFGIRLRFLRTKYQKIFQTIGLTNAMGDSPVLVSKVKLSNIRDELVFDSRYLGMSEFESKRERLEAVFEKKLESIEYGRTQKFIKLLFSSDSLPTLVKLSEILTATQLDEAQFVPGKSANGLVLETISDLPHMLISGTTGSGKSVAFKQTLCTLLKSTDHMQLYICDLKRGLEAVDFKVAPNVSIVKTMSDAVVLLSKVVKKMEDRFDYLEKNGKKEIVPARDKMERIVLAIDECSVLLTKRDRNDPNHESAMKARMHLDSIAKLGRAAAINLILATQKIEKETIPTTVQENITGRLVFKANTLQGSLIPLGNKDALELPDIPGRAIWKLGNIQTTVQVPFIGEKEVCQIATKIAEEFTIGTKFLFEPMMTGEVLPFVPARPQLVNKFATPEG